MTGPITYEELVRWTTRGYTNADDSRFLELARDCLQKTQLLDAIFAHCNVVLPRGLEYPFEHNPHANKDMRHFIEAELRKRIQ